MQRIKPAGLSIIKQDSFVHSQVKHETAYKEEDLVSVLKLVDLNGYFSKWAVIKRLLVFYSWCLGFKSDELVDPLEVGR